MSIKSIGWAFLVSSRKNQYGVQHLDGPSRNIFQSLILIGSLHISYTYIIYHIYVIFCIYIYILCIYTYTYIYNMYVYMHMYIQHIYIVLYSGIHPMHSQLPALFGGFRSTTSVSARWQAESRNLRRGGDCHGTLWKQKRCWQHLAAGSSTTTVVPQKTYRI